MSAMLFVWKTSEERIGNIPREEMDKNFEKGRENES